MERGIAATSMDDIAAAVPASKMTIYKYFQSKDGLLEEVLTRFIEKGKGDLRALLQKDGDPLETLETMMGYDGGLQVSVVFATDLLQGYPELSRHLLNFSRTSIIPLFEEAIFRCQRAGKVRKELSPHLIVLFLMAVKEYFVKPEVVAGLTDLNGITDQLLSLFYYGIIDPSNDLPRKPLGGRKEENGSEGAK
jgi:AcrR family transcriptional regulator